MAIRITEDGVVIYENEPEVDRELFPNIKDNCGCQEQIDEIKENLSELQELVGTKAGVIYETASGAFASFADGADDMLLKSCVVNIEPIQEGEGDPSPENVRAIRGRTGLNVVRTGKNLVDDSIKRTNAANTIVAIGGGSGDYYLFLHPGIYTLSCKFADGVHYGALCKETSSSQIAIWTTVSTATNASFTISKAGLYRLWFYRPSGDGGVSVDDVSDVLLEVGPVATEYEPYKGSTYSVNWESEAGTVYGGYVDVVSGKLIVDRGYIASYNGETLPSTWISDRDVYAQDAVPTTGAQVVYKLAESVEYQLTPQEVRTLLGENNICSDGGDMEVEYPADTKMYIEKLTEPTENDMIADHAISANSFFMVGNTLYRATTAIANGATITDGTNAVKLSLSDALNELA